MPGLAANERTNKTM